MCGVQAPSLGVSDAPMLALIKSIGKRQVLLFRLKPTDSTQSPCFELPGLGSLQKLCGNAGDHLCRIGVPVSGILFCQHQSPFTHGG